jgi:hypothetical protein
MRSPKGFYGAIALLLLLPVADVSSVAFGDEETGLHLALAAGAFLLAFAVFDFKVSKPVNQVAYVATAALGAIFLLQAISPLTTSEAFYDFSYDTVGQWLEGTLTLTFVAWCFVMLLSDSEGTTRLLGLATAPLLLVYAAALWATNLAGVTEPPEVLKMLFLPVMVWLLLESRKSRDAMASSSEENTRLDSVINPRRSAA